MGGSRGQGRGRDGKRHREAMALQGRDVSSFLPSLYVSVQPEADQLPSALSG